ITINKAGVDLIGAGAGNSIIEGMIAVNNNDSGTVFNQTISGFTIENRNVGIACSYTGVNPVIKNNVITNMTLAGIIASQGASPSIVNNSIASNRIGIRLVSSAAKIKNNIIVNNTLCGISAESSSQLTISYNDVFGNSSANYSGCFAGVGDISSDPLFTSTVDFHLQQTSACIDAGDPSDEYFGEPDPNGNRVNMGAYGNTFEAEKNPRPIIVPIGDKTVYPNASLVFQISIAESGSNDSLNFSFGNLPSGATFDPVTQIFEWTPTTAQRGEYTTSITVTNGDGFTNSETIKITVLNNAPSFDMSTIPCGEDSGFCFVHTIAGRTLTFTLSASDLDDDSLTYSASGLPSGATFDPATQIFNWNTTTLPNGYEKWSKFTVVDSFGTSSELNVFFYFGNSAPYFPNNGPFYLVDKYVLINYTLTFQVLAFDPEGDHITYSASNLPPGATFDPETRTFNWTPDQAGIYSVSFTATDIFNASTTKTISLVAVDEPIVLLSIGDKLVYRGSALTFEIMALAPQGVIITYSASNLPPGATFDPATRTFSWIPATGQLGTYQVTFTATDGMGGYDSETIQITVNICGDANADGKVNMLDITYIANYLYKHGPAPKPLLSADVDGGGFVNSLDSTYLINYLYKNGPGLKCK
ncbi:MAG: hypothetical protein COT26_01320, partial [Candidatus Kerfeldbacteria bacterium CG08_land_8_20_14_0_20_43_14]